MLDAVVPFVTENAQALLAVAAVVAVGWYLVTRHSTRRCHAPLLPATAVGLLGADPGGCASGRKFVSPARMPAARVTPMQARADGRAAAGRHAYAVAARAGAVSWVQQKNRLAALRAAPADVAGDFKGELIATCKAITRPGCGILAADESTKTIGSRLAGIGVENTEENRRDYRSIMFDCPGDWNKHISGVIMYDETLFQSNAAGVPFVDVLKDKGIISGIKVDTGLGSLPGTDSEQFVMGLDGLAERCQKYYAQGARFAKWRAVLKIDDGCPSDLAIEANASGLAAYAAICQANGLAPIVEPEILTDGKHDLATCAAVSEKVVKKVVEKLRQQKVVLEGMMLKPNMVLPGAQSGIVHTADEVARATFDSLNASLPAEVPGVTFLSGGQSEEVATEHINAMNKLPEKLPWALTFSFGRALQASVLSVWQGKAENLDKAREVFRLRCMANGLASTGTYNGEAATKESSQSLYVESYTY